MGIGGFKLIYLHVPMKYINQEILKIFSRVEDLLPLERKMREDRNVVVPGSGNGKGFSRAVKRP